MSGLDWTVLIAYFLLMIGVGIWVRRRIKTAVDFFAAGGRMPWWLAGISHHMSGYSAVVFTGFAAIAYTSGFNIYIWWAVSICIGLLIGSAVFAPRWSRLRQRVHIVSPLEYLAVRFNVPTQQVLAWSGCLLKIFDVGAKWTASAILLNVFAGVPLHGGILLVGGVTLIYVIIGGLWADAMTDLSQFVIQLIAGFAMLIAVLMKLGGISAIWTIWDQLPAGHGQPFNGEFTVVFTVVYLLVNTLSYNGGTWNLAQRFIAAPTGKDARRAALLSAALYLFWPLVLFFPSWAGPILLPNLQQPSQVYALLAQQLLPPGLIGLVLAGLFAHTMAMTSSDTNAISAVVTRDIVPAVWKRAKSLSTATELLVGRISTATFIACTIVLALMSDRFGGVIGLILLWYGALLGPIALPILFGMLPAFRKAGPAAAIVSWAAGIVTFALVKYVFAQAIASLSPDWNTTFTVAGPVLASLVVFCGMAALRPWTNPRSEALLEALQSDADAAAVGRG
jgi:SSS family solute:Na+ symporter